MKNLRVKLQYQASCSNQIHKYLTTPVIRKERNDDPKYNMRFPYRIDWKRGIIEFDINDSYVIDNCFKYLKLKVRRI